VEFGRLKHRIIIQRPIRSESLQSGQVVIDWQELCRRWAAIDSPTAKEIQQFAKAKHAITHTVKIRYSPTVTPDCRISFSGRTLNIVGVVNVGEQNRETRIFASEVTN
jgi:SPP1 family predicted phage head-tail adaptor